MKIIYFGGNFEFQYKDYSIDKLAKDYRTEILGDVNKLLHTPNNMSKTVGLGHDIFYCGPYYFYEEDTDGSSIVSNEYSMVDWCTDAIFLIDNTNIPGTITEIIHAAMLKKKIMIFYVKKQLDEGEPENDICSSNWYPLEFAKLVADASLIECEDREMAKGLIYNYVQSLKR